MENGFSFGRWSAQVDAALARIEQKLDTISTQGATIMADLSNVTNEVREATEVQAGAVTLLNQIGQLIRDNATDQDALNGLAADLDASANDLAAAIVANTPAEDGGGEPPPVDPPVEPPA